MKKKIDAPLPLKDLPEPPSQFTADGFSKPSKKEEEEATLVLDDAEIEARR